MQKILIIEDDHGIANSLKLYLKSSDYEVFLEDNGGKAIKAIQKYSPHLIILDLNLPEKDGIEIITEYRKDGSTPIIMLTAKSGELDRIEGLELGADDYIAKPFSPRELLARIKTILRRTYKKEEKEILSQDEKDIIKHKEIKIDKEKNIVYINDKSIDLTSNEYEILLALLEKKGGILTREEIMKDIMGYDKYIYDRTVDTHIKNLRKKITPCECIKTVRGTGYRLAI